MANILTSENFVKSVGGTLSYLSYTLFGCLSVLIKALMWRLEESKRGGVIKVFAEQILLLKQEKE